MTNQQREIIRNTIYAVETGGHIYGNKKYNCLIEAGTNTANETAITIGAGQFHATNAKLLLNRIREADSNLFKQLDTAGIGYDLDHANWDKYNVSKGSSKAKCIQKIIDTEVGHKEQDKLFDEQIEAHMNEAKNLGVYSLSSQAMCANFTHHGGSGATKRIVARAKSKFNSTELQYIYKACLMDDKPNQVGTYKDRQDFVYTNLNTRLLPIENETKEDIVKEEQKPVIKEEPKKETVTPITTGSSKVKIAQKKLNSLFGEKLKITGVWDNSCRIAYVRSLQKALNKVYKEGLKVDGDYGPKTIAAVNRHRLRKGNNNLYVKMLQIGLYAHDISLIGEIDGSFGDSTWRGTRVFQERMKIEVDGIAGKDTFTCLVKK